MVSTEKFDEYIALAQAIEFEADYLALDLLKDAGFDPNKSLGYLRKIRNFYALLNVQQGGDQSTHPSVAVRYEKLSEILKWKKKLTDVSFFITLLKQGTWTKK